MAGYQIEYTAVLRFPSFFLFPCSSCLLLFSCHCKRVTSISCPCILWLSVVDLFTETTDVSHRSLWCSTIFFFPLFMLWSFLCFYYFLLSKHPRLRRLRLVLYCNLICPLIFLFCLITLPHHSSSLLILLYFRATLLGGRAFLTVHQLQAVLC